MGWPRREGPSFLLHGPSGQSPPGQNCANRKKKWACPLDRPTAFFFSLAQGDESPLILNSQTLTGCSVLLSTRQRWLLPASIPSCSIHLPASCGDRSREGTPSYHYMHATVNPLHHSRRNLYGIREAMAFPEKFREPYVPGDIPVDLATRTEQLRPC